MSAPSESDKPAVGFDPALPQPVAAALDPPVRAVDGKSAPPRFRKRAKASAALLTACALALLSELALSLALPRSDFLEADLQPHPVLGQMIKPGDNGHDPLGFRNPVFPKQADIVAIGDSNTYGVNARSHQSWPGHLQQILGRTTYNAGLGGFGPLHHLHAAREFAPRFAPKVEIVAVYLGNDLIDAYNLAHEFPYWRDWRIGVRPQGVLSEGEKLWHEATAKDQNARLLGGLRDWLAMNSMLYSVVRHTLLTPLANAMRQQSTAPVDPEMKTPWVDPRHPEVKVVFTPKVILGAEDPSSPQVDEGIRISERALAEIARHAKAHGVKMVLAFIPTKERAYCGALQRTAAPMTASHRRICDIEPETVARLARAAAAEGATVVDTTAALDAAIERGVKVYPPGSDSHAVSAGYRVMAEAIAAVVKPLL
jgi:lysophospholipase L1-like esterase